MQGVPSVAGETTRVNGIETLHASTLLRPRSPFPLVCREGHPEPTIVQARGLRVGNGHLGLIAGPCSVESREQILDIACAVQDAGATALRGGAFKPRTSPYSFQGLKEAGLELLAEA